jgi:hypothetical protein
MSYYMIIVILLILLTLIVPAAIARAVPAFLTGRLQARGSTYERNIHPEIFWLGIAFWLGASTLSVLAFTLALWNLLRDVTMTGPAYMALLTVTLTPALLIPLAIRFVVPALRTGRIELRSGTYDRSRQPARFWLGVMGWLIMSALSILCFVFYLIAFSASEGAT